MKPLSTPAVSVTTNSKRLGDTVEHAATAFEALDRPGADRLGVTALNVPGKQFVWLDAPDSDHSWPLGSGF